jgi:hypothetical protein
MIAKTCGAGGNAMLAEGGWLLPLAAVLAGMTRQAHAINWQEAVARLAQERTQAETCVRLLKKYGDPAAVDRGALAYGEAKAEYDGIIAGLSVALARKAQPESLQDLEERLQRGVAKRDAFCQSVHSLIPDQTGERGVIDQIVSAALKPLIEALQAIYLRAKDDSALTRETIHTQLEATAWPDFAAVTPAP